MHKKVYIIILDITATGGTERAVINLANMLVPYVNNVSIISLLSYAGGKSYFSLDNNICVKHLGMNIIPACTIRKLFWYLKLYNILLKNVGKGSIVIGSGHNLNFILSLFIGRKRIACEHIQLDSIPVLHRKIMSILYRNLDLLVVLSESARRKLEKYNKCIKIIPNALPFLPCSCSSLNEKKIIMVGRLSEEKGYERVVNVALFLKAKYPLWSIHIFGDGPIKQSLIALYKDKGVDDWVYIHDPVRNIQVEYLKSSIYLMTSYNEALPMVILEAKSCGLPVVAYKCEGTMELITEDYDGYLIDNGNIDLLNQKLEYLINDFDKRSIMGQNAITSCHKFRPEIISHLWIEQINLLS